MSKLSEAQRRISHHMMIDLEPFPVFNDDGSITMDAIAEDDLIPVTVHREDKDWYASATWSAGCEWYFVVLSHGIVLLNVFSEHGLLCRKKSARFIELFLERPDRKPKSRHPGGRIALAPEERDE